MSNDTRHMAKSILEGLYDQACYEIDVWETAVCTDEIAVAEQRMALIIWNDHIKILGYFAYINHIEWPPKKARLKLVVNNA
jgi:hypothetical protein